MTESDLEKIRASFRQMSRDDLIVVREALALELGGRPLGDPGRQLRVVRQES